MLAVVSRIAVTLPARLFAFAAISTYMQHLTLQQKKAGAVRAACTEYLCTPFVPRQERKYAVLVTVVLLRETLQECLRTYVD